MTDNKRASSPRLKEMAKMMRTVSHPNRLAIIELLSEYGPMKVKDIIFHIGISQSNASQHLKALEGIGILESERDGKCIAYTVKKSGIGDLLAAIAACIDC